jgi:steroid delta-isomerase-like uncharacterized protein
MNANEVIKLNDEVIQAWNSKDVEKFLKLCDQNIVWRDLGTPEPFKGKEGARKFYNQWQTAFPDFKLKIISTVATTDNIAVEVEFSGTNTGPLKMGDAPDIPATRKKVTASRGAYIGRVKDGKFTTVNTYPDLIGMMMQLGLMQEMHV